MKLIALTENKSFIEFLNSQKKLLKSELSLDLVLETKKSKVNGAINNQKCLLLIDLDLKSEAEALKQDIKGKIDLKWIGVSQVLGPKDFRKMQMEDFGPDALAKIPIEADDFFDTVKNMISSLEDTGQVSDVSESGLNFLGLSDGLVDEQNGDKTDASFQELNLNEDVKLALNEHESTSDAEEALASNTNFRIQNKFDLAFSNDESLSLKDESNNGLQDNSLSLSADESNTIDVSPIALNLSEGTTSGLLPGLKISASDDDEEVQEKTIKAVDDIGRLEITSTGIKFKKSDLDNIKSEPKSNNRNVEFKFDQHKVNKIVDDESDINLNFTNIPKEVSFDAKAISLQADDNDLRLDKNSEIQLGKDLGIGADESSEEAPPDSLSFEDEDGTVLSQNFNPKSELPDLDFNFNDQPPSLEMTNLLSQKENATNATMIDPMASKRKGRSGPEDGTDFNSQESFNEFKAQLDVTHQDADPGREHFTIDTDLISGDKSSLGFNLDDDNNHPPVAPKKSAEKVKTSSFKHENLEEQVRDRNLYMDDLGRLKATIHDLREERETFTDKVGKLETENEALKSNATSMKAELEELKAEIKLINSRNNMRVEDLRKEIDLLHDKKILLEEKNKSLKNEIIKLEQKSKIDMNQVRQREKELEGQLDLIKMDTESQVYTRDTKILDLKKKIDALEFNMENMAIKEQKVLEDKIKLEERLNKIMSTLRGSIKVLEEDVDLDQDA